MGRLKDSTENKAMGTHFTWEHRLQLQYFHEGTGKFPKIRNRRILAEKLGKSTRTIQRELQRGMVMHETSNIPFHKMEYNAEYAQLAVRSNDSAKGPQLKLGKDRILVSAV